MVLPVTICLMAGNMPAASPAPRSPPRPAVPITTADGAFLHAAMNDPIIAFVNFTDGTSRAVFEKVDGHQYVVNDEGDPVFGVWFIPKDEIDLPLIVDAEAFGGVRRG